MYWIWQTGPMHEDTRRKSAWATLGASEERLRVENGKPKCQVALLFLGSAS